MNPMGKCIVIGAGDLIRPARPVEADLVIAADAGFLHAQALGLAVDVVIGDFDSLERVPDHPNVVRLNPIKDETDMLAAIRLGMARGCGEFHLLCGTGGRLSHTLANIACLNMLAESGLRGYLYAKGEVIIAIKDGAIRFDRASRGYVSVFALSGVCDGVDERGLKYGLTNYSLRSADAIGVSNEFVGEEAEISVRAGTLLILYGTEANLVG